MSTADYFSAADLIARVPPDQFLRMFDPMGTGTADQNRIATCVRTANSKVKMRCQAAFGVEFNANGGTVDEAIIAMACAYACLEAVIYHPGFTASQQSAFAGAVKIADEFFDRLCKDDRNRVVESPVGRSLPRARTLNAQDANGAYTAVFARARDGREPSDY